MFFGRCCLILPETSWRLKSHKAHGSVETQVRNRADALQYFSHSDCTRRAACHGLLRWKERNAKIGRFSSFCHFKDIMTHSHGVVGEQNALTSHVSPNSTTSSLNLFELTFVPFEILISSISWGYHWPLPSAMWILETPTFPSRPRRPTRKLGGSEKAVDHREVQNYEREKH